MSVSLQSIANRVRLCPISWSALLVPYIPIGFIIVILRIFILLHIYLSSLVLFTFSPIKRFVIRCMSVILGFAVVVKKDTDEQTDSNVTLVTNHVTLFDHMILHLSVSCFTPYKHVFSWAKTRCPIDFDQVTVGEIKDLIKQRNESLHLLPESLPTGDSNLMIKFNPIYFRGLDHVQPVVYPIDWKLELFWQLFCPFTVYQLHYLRPLVRDVSETDVQFSTRIMKALSNSLHAHSLAADSKDLLALVESSSQSEQARPTPSVTTHREDRLSSPRSQTNPDQELRHRSAPVKPLQHTPLKRSAEMDSNIQAVLGVLPHVPLTLAHRELERTNGDVDGVITDILEGRIVIDDQDYQQQPAVDATGSVQPGPVAPSAYSAAGETFSRRAEERQSSFAERKKKFMDNAKARFILKHPEYQS